MAKYWGKIGFSENVETRPGVWEERITERYYDGEWLRDSRSLRSGSDLNDNFSIANKLSILSDPFVKTNIVHLRYVDYMGIKWKVSSVEPLYPRIILTLGGEYNG